MSRENVYDDFTSSDTKGERHEGLLHWAPFPPADSSAVLMVSQWCWEPFSRCGGCELRNCHLGGWGDLVVGRKVALVAICSTISKSLAPCWRVELACSVVWCVGWVSAQAL